MNQTCRTLLEKQGQAHKWCTPMDPHIWPGKSGTTSTNIHSAARIQDVALKTCQRWWTIGKSVKWGSGISVLVAWHDDDDASTWDWTQVSQAIGKHSNHHANVQFLIIDLGSINRTHSDATNLGQSGPESLSIRLFRVISWTFIKGVLPLCWEAVVLYSHMQIHIYIYMQHHDNTIIKQTNEDFFRKICNSHFIVRIRKGLLKVCAWEGAGDRTETAIFQPHSYGHQCCVFLVLLMLNRRPWGPLCWVMAFFTASYQQLFWTPIQSGTPSPFSLVWLSLPHLVYNSIWSLTATSLLTELYNSPTSTQSPTWSLESHVWSSLSGNNSHAVHRSLSSGASVYECTMGIFLPRPIS